MEEKASVNTVDRRDSVKSVEEKVFAITEKINHTVKTVEGHRSALTEDLSDSVKIVEEKASVITVDKSIIVKSVKHNLNSLFFITWSSYEKYLLIYRNINQANPPTTTVITARLISCLDVSGLTSFGVTLLSTTSTLGLSTLFTTT